MNLHFTLIRILPFVIMSQSRSLSRLATTGLFVGVSCFVQGGGSTFGLNRYDTDIVTTRTTNPNGGGAFLPGSFPSKYRQTTEIRGEQKIITTTSQQVSLYAHSTEPSDVTRRMASSYSLIWSPGFLPKVGVSVTLFTALHMSGIAGRVGTFLWSYWNKTTASSSILLHDAFGSSLRNVVLPLLSSSCCLVQLVINALVGAGGCAGFNTILGPLRPALLSLLAYLNWVAPPTIGQGLIRLTLALSPEIVDFWNRWMVESTMKKYELVGTGSGGMIEAVVEVDIPTMGCVACINKIDTVLRQSAPNRIVDASSWLDPTKTKGGQARVRCTVDSQDELNDVRKQILGSIEGAGFSDPVISRWYYIDEQRH